MSDLIRLADFSEEKPIAIQTSGGALELSVAAVKQWLAPDASVADCLKLLMVCKTANLNPILREAYLVPFGDKHEVIVSKNGWLKRAHSQPDYRGHESGIIAQQFDPKTNARGKVEHLNGTFLPPGMIVLGGWAKVHRQGFERPYESLVSMTEYAKQTKTWKEMPCTMISKVALTHAIAEAFGLRDAFDEGEVTESIKSDEIKARPIVSVDPVRDIFEVMDQFQAVIKEIRELKERINPPVEVWFETLRKRGVSRIEDLEFDQCLELVEKLRLKARELDIEINQEVTRKP